MDTAHYDYELPRELIAQRPLGRRSDSRLMVVDRSSGQLEHHHFRDLPELLSAGDGLVINDTRVVPARLVGRRSDSGGRWEGLWLQADSGGFWRLICKCRGKLRIGERITLLDRDARDAAQLWLVEQQDGGQWVALPETEETTWELLERVGRVPLPHYIRGGEMVDEDRGHYQTVFADVPGSAAAPTAGLHFSASLLDELKDRGVEIVRATLHVGLDTFRPIQAETLDEHRMHSEWCSLSAQAAARLRDAKQHGGRVVAVGTTSVRTLETAAAGREIEAWEGQTDLFIRPPYEFRAVDALVTNFHLPRSTLLVLVRTFGGEALMRRAYEEAIREEYRFYSYGDAMLIV